MKNAFHIFLLLAFVLFQYVATPGLISSKAGSSKVGLYLEFSDELEEEKSGAVPVFFASESCFEIVVSHQLTRESTAIHFNKHTPVYWTSAQGPPLA